MDRARRDSDRDLVAADVPLPRSVSRTASPACQVRLKDHRQPGPPEGGHYVWHVRLKADTTSQVRLKADPTSPLRLKADTTCRPRGHGKARPHGARLRNIRAHASSVAPVVRTSSTSTTTRRRQADGVATREQWRNLKASRTFRRLPRPGPVCDRCRAAATALNHAGKSCGRRQVGGLIEATPKPPPRMQRHRHGACARQQLRSGLAHHSAEPSRRASVGPRT